jgi:hypothetical protein
MMNAINRKTRQQLALTFFPLSSMTTSICLSTAARRGSPLLIARRLSLLHIRKNSFSELPIMSQKCLKLSSLLL